MHHPTSHLQENRAHLVDECYALLKTIHLYSPETLLNSKIEIWEQLGVVKSQEGEGEEGDDDAGRCRT